MREDLLIQFYLIMEQFRVQQGGYKYLRDPIPQNFKAPGVYFFFDDGISRTPTNQLRVVRVGKTSRNDRLGQHRGNIGNGGGNHRESIFRKHVGGSIIFRDGLQALYPQWYEKDQIEDELPMEQAVSNYIRQLPYIYRPTNANQIMAEVERRSIELLSNFEQPEQIDVPPENWLGYHCPNQNVVSSHLWNVHYVQKYQPNNEGRYLELLNILMNI